MFGHSISDIKSLPGQEAKKSFQTSSCKGHKGNCSVEIMSRRRRGALLEAQVSHHLFIPRPTRYQQPSPCQGQATGRDTLTPCTAPGCHQEKSEHNRAQLHIQRCWEWELPPPPIVPMGSGPQCLHTHNVLFKEHQLENRLFLGEGTVVCDVPLCCPCILWFSR